MTKGFLLSAVAAAAIISSSPAPAQSRGPELGYFLQRARVGVVVNQMILACPGPGHPDPEIETDVTISAPARPDPAAYVILDARSHFLSGRTTKLGLRADGTLASYSATTTGEGGEVISAAIGIATTIAGSLVGVPVVGKSNPTAMEMTLTPLTCNEDTARRVRQRAEVEGQLTELRARIAHDGASAADSQVLAELSAQLAELVEALTLGSRIPIDPSPADFQPTQGEHPSPAPTERLRAVDHVDYGQWFSQTGSALQEGLTAHHVGGQYGVVATLTPDAGLLPILGRGDDSPAPGRTTLDLYYRRPVPATVAVAWCADAYRPVPHHCAPVDATLKSDIVLLPQLSGRFSIPIGRGGIFGTRQAAATFDEQGAPLTLEYGATTGGSAIAGAINAGGTAITTLRDAETAAITRRLAREKAIHDLNDLQADPHPDD